MMGKETAMEPTDHSRIPRRVFLHGALAVGAAAVVGGCSDGSSSGDGAGAPATTGAGSRTTAAAGEQSLEPTPACPDGDEATPAQTEGPYFTPDSPERADLREGVASGTGLVLSGAVVDTACRPLGRALLDFWQADAEGNYDNDGYRLRGHVFADGQGRFRVETVVPGLYTGRTRHLHVKVQPPDGEILTTQLYFPGEPANARDRIFRPQCVMQVADAVGGKQATFTFVVRP
jgi:protocatechuate 3,4-dioxygenase beta subunit